MATIYIAGPMRGYPLFNYPAFDNARDILIGLGVHRVVSPADLDREIGVCPEEDNIPDEMLRECLRRDLMHLLDSDAIVMLDGWRNSKGAVAERALSLAIGIPVLELTHIGPSGITEIVDGISAQ